jgi:diguanylate cyclase (GGDEF)-like protein
MPLLAAACLMQAGAWAQAAPPSSLSSPSSSSIDARLLALGEMSRFVPDKALVQLRQLEADARGAPLLTRAEIHSQLCLAHIRTGDNDAALHLADRLIADGEREKNDTVLAKGVLAKAYVMQALTERSAFHKLAYRAEQLATTSDDVGLRVNAIVAAGESRAEEGNFPAALIKLQTAVELARQSELPLPRLDALNSLARLYDSMKEYGKGLEALDEAVLVAQGAHSAGELALAKNDEYILASDANQPERARQALLDGLAIEQKLGAQRMIGKTLVNLSDSYLRQHDYATTLTLANQAISASKISNDVGIEAVARVNIGQALIGLGRIAEGKKSFEAGMRYYEKANNKPEIQSVLLEYGNALERAGVLAGAMDAYRRARKISNEMFEQQRQQTVYELQARFEAERKQRQIELLSRDNQVKGAEIEHRRLEQRVWWLLLLAFSLGAAIVGLLYRRVRHTHAQLENKNLELQQQSARDPLTALYNRRHFQEFMNAPRAPGEGDGVGALYLLDVDHFKSINDRWGHAAGDAVLTAIAGNLVELVRETDMIVRWGGEEFLVFLPSLRRGGIDEVAQRMLDGISAQTVGYQGRLLNVSVSIGFAPFPLVAEAALSWERSVNLVDMALYLAKAGGRNRACGVRGFKDLGATSMEAIEKDLEAAWRAGHVDLEMVVGRAAGAPPGGMSADRAGQ